MDERRLQAKLIIQARRMILDGMNSVYTSVLIYNLIADLVPTLEDGPLRFDLQYLIDKGYIECVNCRADARRLPPWEQRLFKLTPAGKEIADRIVFDHALEP